MIFVDKLNAAVAKNKSLVCVGLDTDPELIPSGMSMLDFNKAIIDVTADLVCAFKPNIAFRSFWMPSAAISAIPPRLMPKRSSNR
jgi:orotidine-5'-phosphate decarboxylase